MLLFVLFFEIQLKSHEFPDKNKPVNFETGLKHSQVLVHNALLMWSASTILRRNFRDVGIPSLGIKSERLMGGMNDSIILFV